MGQFASLSQLVNRITGGNSGTPEKIFWWKDNHVSGASAAAPVAQRLTSLWQYEGSPAHGAAPGSVGAPSNATNGALKQTDPGGGRSKYLMGVSLGVGASGITIVYDRLLHISGMSGTNVGAQTVGGTLNRYTDGVGNQIWAEIYTQIGASSTTITGSYSNTVPTSGRTTQAVNIGNTGYREAQRLLPMTLQAGDLGVSAVANVTLAGTTGTAGDFGITVAHPLMQLPAGVAGGGSLRDAIAGVSPFIEIKTGACIAIAFLPNITTAPQWMLSFSFVEI